ncbi:MAG: alpha/beta hydrolase family protein [Promethearchaeota archaeon]|jgi:dipeptidyl aminopeptidase/acylaminoacyl peptidase
MIVVENVDIPVELANIFLKGSIYYTSKTPVKAPWLINLAAFMHSRENYLVKFFSEKFANAGYYVLSYDYRAHGETKTQTGPNYFKMMPQIFSDIHVVLDWVVQNQSNRVLENKIALFGRSLGGAIILSHGFIDEKARILISLSARYDYETIQNRYQRRIPEKESVDYIKKISPKFFLREDQLNNERILIAHCRDDEIVPFNNLYQIKDQLGLRSENVIEFSTGGHSFKGHREEIFKYSLEFLKKL